MKHFTFLLLVSVTLLMSPSHGLRAQTITVLLSETDTTKKDTIGESLLMSTAWMTCAYVDSINEFHRIQLIRGSLLDTLENCTSNGCGRSDWKFENVDGLKQLSIHSWLGCPGDVLYGVSIQSWNWNYNEIEHLITLTGKDGKEQFLLRVESISAYGLRLSVVNGGFFKVLKKQ